MYCKYNVNKIVVCVLNFTEFCIFGYEIIKIYLFFGNFIINFFKKIIFLLIMIKLYKFNWFKI